MISPAYHISFADGNIGAKSFLLSLERYSEENPISAQYIWEMIQRTKLKGSKLWVLYSDAANQSFEQLYDICWMVDDEVIIQAASEPGNSKSILNAFFNRI